MSARSAGGPSCVYVMRRLGTESGQKMATFLLLSAQMLLLKVLVATIDHQLRLVSHLTFLQNRKLFKLIECVGIGPVVNDKICC